MKEEETKKDFGTRSIPRNPNQPISDEEIDMLLKSAAEQIADKKSNSDMSQEKRQDIELKKQETKKKEQEEKARKEAEAKKKEQEETARKEAEAKKKEQEEKARKEAEAKKKEQEETARKEAEAKKKEQEEKARREAEAKEKEQEEKARKEIEARKAEEAGSEMFAVEEPFVVEPPKYVDNPYKEKITFGLVVGTFLETVWTVFKLAVIVTVVTVIAGFFLSRDMMIRGRNGNRLSTEGMVVSATSLSTKGVETEKVKKWLTKVKREKVTLEADDGRVLVARKIVKDADSNQWVVILHGYNGSMEDIYDIAMHYYKEDYNVLMPDLRAHGESEGSFIGMGWLDRLDVINWIDVILADNPSARVAIHGVDIGADTALMLSGEPLKSSIKVIVAEGAYTSAWDVMHKEYELRHEKLPAFPFMNMMNPVMKVWAGYSLKEADATKQVGNAKVPILLIHGDNDTYATEDMTTKLEEAISSEHETLHIVTGTHEDCRYAEQDTYYNKALEFVGKYMR